MARKTEPTQLRPHEWSVRNDLPNIFWFLVHSIKVIVTMVYCNQTSSLLVRSLVWLLCISLVTKKGVEKDLEMITTPSIE